MANVSIKCAKCGMSLPPWSVHEDPCPGLKEEDLNEPEPTELMTWECPRCHSIHNELKVTCDCQPKSFEILQRYKEWLDDVEEIATHHFNKDTGIEGAMCLVQHPDGKQCTMHNGQWRKK